LLLQLLELQLELQLGLGLGLGLGLVVVVELPLASVEEDVVAICDGSEGLDTAELNLGTTAVEGPLIVAGGEEGEGTDVGAGEGLGGIEDGKVPEDGVGKGEDGGDGELVGDCVEGYGEGLGYQDPASALVVFWGGRVDVEVDEESEDMVGAAQETGVAVERSSVEDGCGKKSRPPSGA
jgi:hypothetical protein